MIKGFKINRSGWENGHFCLPLLKGSQEKGFTLIELMIGLAVFSLVGAVIYSVMINMTRSFTTQEAHVQVQQQLRAAGDLIIQDIRMGGYDPKGDAIDPDIATDGKPGITAATSQSIQFTADLDGDGTINDPNAADGIDITDFERMAYEYNNGANRIEQVLIKADASEVDRSILLDNVTACTFAYLDEDNVNVEAPVSAANLSRIRTVDFDMTLSQPAGLSGSISRRFSTRIKCRNLGLE